MATLTKSTGTVTLSGAVEKVSLPAAFGWVWVKNMSDSDMFLGLDDGISAGADGVFTIPSGDAGRIQTDGQDSVYLMGTGNALVVAQNYADCPFKLGGKGGEAPDLSEYAKKTDIPTELPANGGNADTVDGFHADEFIKVNSGGDVAITGNLNVDGYIASSDASSSDHNHALLMGHNLQDYWDFFEYGGLFRFYKSQSGTDTLLGKITDNGWEGNVVGDVTGSINGWSIYNHINDNDFDADNAKSIGIYRINSGHGSNLPTANGYDIFVTNLGGYITQLAIADNAAVYIRYYDLSSWNSWREVYTSGNKPYVAGSVVATSTTITTNHGFQPSAVLYSIASEDYNVRGTLAFDSTSFTALGNISSSGTLVQYIIFK